MLNIIQCDQPPGFGASKSKIVTAKLLVFEGAPDQRISGERFAPLHPERL
jgi:hypothetical protein